MPAVDAISRVRSVHLTRNPARNVAFLFALASTGPRPGKGAGVCGARAGCVVAAAMPVRERRLVTSDNARIPTRQGTIDYRVARCTIRFIAF